MKYMIIAFTFIMLFFTSPGYAHAVSMNFEFNIDGSRDNTIIHANDTDYNTDADVVNTVFSDPEKKYVSAEKDGVVASLVSAASKIFHVRVDTTSSLNSFLFQISQDDDDARFLIAFTEGTWQDIEGQTTQKIPSRTYGTFMAAPANNLLYYLLLERTDIDFVNDIRIIGLNRLLLKNLGIKDGRTKVSVEIL